MTEFRSISFGKCTGRTRPAGRCPAGRTIEIVIYGGSALLLTLNRQINTGDVDAVFEGNRISSRSWQPRWLRSSGGTKTGLNDGVKGWLSNRDADPDVKALFKTYPTEEQPGLRVYTARPEYLFAMKCRAMRVGGVETNSDIDDIKLLARAIGIKNSQDALTLVEKFYPQEYASTQDPVGVSRRSFRISRLTPTRINAFFVA